MWSTLKQVLLAGDLDVSERELAFAAYRLGIDESDIFDHLQNTEHSTLTVYCGIDDMADRFGFYNTATFNDDIEEIAVETGFSHDVVENAALARYSEGSLYGDPHFLMVDLKSLKEEFETKFQNRNTLLNLPASLMNELCHKLNIKNSAVCTRDNRHFYLTLDDKTHLKFRFADHTYREGSGALYNHERPDYEVVLNFDGSLGSIKSATKAFWDMVEPLVLEANGKGLTMTDTVVLTVKDANGEVISSNDQLPEQTREVVIASWPSDQAPLSTATSLIGDDYVGPCAVELNDRETIVFPSRTQALIACRLAINLQIGGYPSVRIVPARPDQPVTHETAIEWL